MMSRVRKRLNAAERRDKILSAAARSFAADGYDRAKMDDIAVGAGVTKPVLYDHFRSKQALFLAVLESVRDRLIARGRSIAAENAEPEQKFHRAVDALFRFVEQEPDAARTLLMTPSGDLEAARLSREMQAGASEGLSVLLASFVRADDLHMQAVTEFLKQGLHALALWWLDHPDMTRKEVVDIVMRIAWSGLQRSHA